jgi:hypothetical protein
MRYVIALLAILVAASSVEAKEWRAPEKWRGKWKGETVVTYVHPDQVVKTCNRMYRDAGDPLWFLFSVPASYACTLEKRFMKDGVCRIVVSNRPMAGFSVAEMVKHEQDHCAGWPAHHPN